LGSQKLSGEYVAFAEPDLAFDVEGSHHVPIQDEISEAGKIRLQGGLDCIAQVFSLAIPIAVGQLVRGVLDEAGHYVLARGRHVRIEDGLHCPIYVGTAAESAALGIIERLLQLVDGGGDVDHPLKQDGAIP
jgi:hypothetical protein